MAVGRILAIGDVHGCASSLQQLVDWVKPKKGDIVVMLGDYVDRGPNSKGVVEYLLDWKLESDLVLIKGNHEQIMEEATKSSEHFGYWCDVGGLETVISYGAKLDNVPKKHWGFIKNGLPYYETGHCIFVHGGLDPDLPLEKQDPEEMAWRRFPDARSHISGKQVICGHTVQRSGYPNDLGHSICIDTGACRPDGWLTCLNPMTRRYWQVNEKGKTRDGVLDT